MTLDFVTLVVENFGSFIGKHELDLRSFGPGLHFIKGKNKEELRLGANGVGKSMIWNALCWCLYGKTPDGRRNPDIQPRFGKGTPYASVNFFLGTTPYRVERTTNPNQLTLDEEVVGQDKIDQLIGLNFETFTHTILLGQGRPLFFDLQPKAKMDLFGSVLTLDRWETRSEYAAQAARSLQERFDTLNGELTGVEAQQEQIKTLLEKAKKDWAGWRDAQEAEASQAKEKLGALRKAHERLEDERASFDLAYDSAETELKAIQKKLGEISLTRDALLEEKSKTGALLAVHKEKARSLRTELAILGDADECPTCGQSLEGTNLLKHQGELELEQQNVAKKLSKEEQAWKVIADKLSELDALLMDGRRHQAAFAAKVEAARRDLDNATPKLAKLSAEIAQLQEASKKKVSEVNPYTEQVETLRTKRKTLAVEHKERAIRLQKLSAQIERTKFWVKGFKEVRLYIIEDVLQELELTTNSALDEIGLVDWQVQYSIEKETKSGTVQRGLNVMIQSPKDKSPVKWECWSGGEGQRLRLVGALALSEVLLARAGVEAKMEILDEPTRGLSDEGVVDLCEYLADRAKQLNRQIWYVDHMSVESARFTSVLTVTKDKKGSHLVET